MNDQGRSFIMKHIITIPDSFLVCMHPMQLMDETSDSERAKKTLLDYDLRFEKLVKATAGDSGDSSLSLVSKLLDITRADKYQDEVAGRQVHRNERMHACIVFVFISLHCCFFLVVFVHPSWPLLK